MRITVDGRPRGRPRTGDVVRIRMKPPVRRPSMSIGLQMPADGHDLSVKEAALLRVIRLGHVRVDLHLSSDTWTGELARGVRTLRALETSAELAVFLDAENDSCLAQLAEQLARAQVTIARVLVFGEGSEITSRRQLDAARRVLAAVATNAPFIAGTDFHFCELNRHRPTWLASADGVTFSITPQVHAEDDWSLVENLEGQAEAVRAARSLWPNSPVVIGSVALRPRFNLDG